MKTLCHLIPFACPFLDHLHDGLFFHNPKLPSRSFSPLTILIGCMLWSQHGEICPIVILALITTIFNYFCRWQIFALFETVQKEFSFRCSLFTFSTIVKLQLGGFIYHSSDWDQKCFLLFPRFQSLICLWLQYLPWSAWPSPDPSL